MLPHTPFYFLTTSPHMRSLILSDTQILFYSLKLHHALSYSHTSLYFFRLSNTPSYVFTLPLYFLLLILFHTLLTFTSLHHLVKIIVTFPFSRIRISTSLGRRRSFSEQVRWRIWKNSGPINCEPPASASRKRSVAGWSARSTCAWNKPPSSSRDTSEDTRPDGEEHEHSLDDQIDG